MNVGTICYTTCQGIAHLARDFYDNGIINRVFTYPHPGYINYPSRYGDKSYSRRKGPDRGVEAFLTGLDILFVFESALDWDVAREAHRRGIKIVAMPMYEYSPVPFLVPVSLYVFPSKLDQEIYSFLPGTKDVKGIYIPVPVKKEWRLRECATEFVHNAGHGQWQYSKGTPELLEAMRYVQSPITLLVRGQPGDRVHKLFRQYRNMEDAGKVRFYVGDLPEEELYKTGDVFIYPEKYNGLSLPLQEAFASGMLVMTTNRFPANDWLPTDPLLPVDKYEKCKLAIEFDRAVLDPFKIARKIDQWYNRDISRYSTMGREYAERNSWEVLKPKYLEALASIL